MPLRRALGDSFVHMHSVDANTRTRCTQYKSATSGLCRISGDTTSELIEDENNFMRKRSASELHWQ